MLEFLKDLMPELFLMTSFAIFSLIEFFWPNQVYQVNRPWFKHLFWLQIGGVLLTYAIGLIVTDDYHQYIFLPSLTHFFSGISPIINGLIGYFVVTFINYWWHRLRHKSDLLWRLFHQIHHSTHRLQTATALYSHPFDYASTVFIINLVSFCVFGFDALSATWTTAWVGVFELWEHTNIRTPRWLGYLVVRPEMHRIHHEIGKHQNNYAIPIWDLIFGTYENSHRKVQCGFQKHRETRLFEMLIFKNVHKD